MLVKNYQAGRFFPRATVLAREIGGEMVLLDPDRGVYYGLNEVGTRIWALLAEGSSREQIEAQLVAEYDTSLESVRIDLQNLLAELLEHGLIDELGD